MGRVPQRLKEPSLNAAARFLLPQDRAADLALRKARMPADHDLQLVGVGKTYDNGAPAVIDFNLNVAKGEFVAFLGPSGCGKTTTLRMIAGFETITTGDILIRGRRINDLPAEKRPTSMIFQSYALFPHMNVRENIAYGLKVKGLDKKAIAD